MASSRDTQKCMALWMNVRSKEKATWKAYSEWWKTYLSFCEFFDVAEMNSAGRVELTYGWEESVEALRKAVALMAQSGVCLVHHRHHGLGCRLLLQQDA